MGYSTQSFAYVCQLLPPGGSVLDMGAQDLHHPMRGPAGNFFRERGFRYMAFDVGEPYRNRPDVLPVDFNTVTRGAKHEGDTFDVVTNFGTSEHVFDQAGFFELCHDMTKVGGYMVHSVPCAMEGHGLFNYTRKFFEELARTNTYHIEFSTIDHDLRIITAVLCRRSLTEFRPVYDLSNQ